MIFLIASPVQWEWVGGGRVIIIIVFIALNIFKINLEKVHSLRRNKQTCLSKDHFMLKKKKLPTSQAPNEDIFFIMIIQDFLRWIWVYAKRSFFDIVQYSLALDMVSVRVRDKIIWCKDQTHSIKNWTSL